MNSLFYAIGAVFCLSLAEIILLTTRHFIPHAIDSVYTGLTLVLIIPSFSLVDYSYDPGKLTIQSSQVLYFFLSGLAFWVYHFGITSLLSLPAKSIEDGQSKEAPLSTILHDRPYLSQYVYYIAVVGAVAHAMIVGEEFSFK